MSHYRGVVLNRQRTRFIARIRHSNVLIHIGTYDTAIEAARAYDKTAEQLHKEKAIFNFKPFRKITPRQEEIYRLCSYEFMGLSYDAAAKKLGVSRGTIQDALKKARKKCPELFPIRFRKMKKLGFKDWMSNEIVKKF